MINPFRQAVDAFFGRGKWSVTIPVMDGPLQPNQLLESAPAVASAPDLDNLLATPEGCLFSSGNRLMRIAAGEGEVLVVAEFAAPVSCLAGGSGGVLAVGLDGTGMVICGGRHDGTIVKLPDGRPLRCPTAAHFIDDDTLVVAEGSQTVVAAEWKRDLMSLGRSGSVWIVRLDDGAARRLADGLGFPYGIAPAPAGRFLVSEAWRHRVLAVALDGSVPPQPVLSELPGYPARIVAASRGGYWLAMFAVRNQLVEFVLRERKYRERMMEEVDPEFWVAPALTSGKSFKEQLQGGGVKQMGILKPWAPARSYGLVVLCNAAMHPLYSWHSRADGTAHGITSLCEDGGALIAGAKGPGRAVRVDIPTGDVEEWG